MVQSEKRRSGGRDHDAGDYPLHDAGSAACDRKPGTGPATGPDPVNERIQQLRQFIMFCHDFGAPGAPRVAFCAAALHFSTSIEQFLRWITSAAQRLAAGAHGQT
jgi:hypothetical protein